MSKSHQAPDTRHQNPLFFWLLVTGFWLLASSAAHACPMCGELIERGGDAFKAMRFGQGIAWSIAFMFGIPASLIGGFAFFIVRQTQRQSRATLPDENGGNR